MSWLPSECNLICFGNINDEIFRSSSGSTSFIAERLFEYTSSDLINRYKDELGSLAQLPTLIVAECSPSGEPRTPAFLSRIDRVRQEGQMIRFQFHHLSNQLSSEEIFGCGYFDSNSWEFSRTHWAIKDGDLIEKFFSLAGKSYDKNRPKIFNVQHWPLPRLNHVAVMMPFAVEFDSVYQAVQVACDDVHIQPLRVDEIYKPTKITDDIFLTIEQCRLVIADLSGRNPNVLYETGLAHARSRDVIMLTQDEEDIPFDLGQIRYIEYLPNGEGLKKLTEDLKMWLRETLNEN